MLMDRLVGGWLEEANAESKVMDAIEEVVAEEERAEGWCVVGYPAELGCCESRKLGHMGGEEGLSNRR